ncbi:peptidoglycan editing factor PgeF [Synechococcales cyanobacterium C]|uniref:Purine nucleoside phosphorylase n=1 Tax=Petrachloros mirabilis ULC683 TaxID=2781853 RepID=A0A8K1ZXB4_9CYAN|nr:peptidoglycan editing factor PgeF [Petrachloros mirabilis]NCJ06603.1 peptidoglycan editing factor PgeF [Petrachloros mirabilis ULC683]
MHTWHWRADEGRAYLTCSLLEPWQHGFFTRQFWPDTPAELVPVIHAEAFPYRVRQVHGNQVLSAAEVQTHLWQKPAAELAPPAWPEADGLFSSHSQQAVWVCTADCTPILIADQRTGHVAAVHAGWRGTAAKIVPMAVARLLQDQGSQVSDLRVAMGPAIAGVVYQVSVEVAAQVGATVCEAWSSENLPSDAGLQHLPELLTQGAQPAILYDQQPGCARLDVRRVNMLQLEQLGLQPEQVAIAPYCTYQQPQQFFSYRRDHLKQVQWSGIVSA